MTNILTALKPMNGVCHLGDSRRAMNHSDGINLRKSSYDFFNWGNAVANNRLFTMGSLGVSGDRGDQILARVPAAIATGAGTLMLQTGVNAVAQAFAGYTRLANAAINPGVAVTLANVAALEYQDQKYICERFLGAGGQRVILVIEPGAENMNATQLGAVRKLQHLQRQLARMYPNILPFDLPKFLVDAAASTTTTQRFKAGYCIEALGSGVHLGNLGGFKIGITAFANFITANFPSIIPFLPPGPYAIPANSPADLLNNPLFTTANGGSLAAGFTAGSGTTSGPGSYTFARGSGGSGTQSCVVSVQAASDGSPGNECTLEATSVAAGDAFVMKQDPTYANLNVGETIQGVARVTVDAGGVPLAACYLDLQWNDGTNSIIVQDLTPYNNAAIGTEGFTVDLCTEPYKIAAKGAGFCTLRLVVVGSAAGAHAKVRIKQFQMLRFQ